METTFPPTCWDLLLWRLVAMETTFPPTCWLSHRDVLYSPPTLHPFQTDHTASFPLSSLIPALLGKLPSSPALGFWKGSFQAGSRGAPTRRTPHTWIGSFWTPHLKAPSQHLGSAL